MGTRKDDAVQGQAEEGIQKEEYSIGEILKQRGVSRRDFLKFCSAMTAAMALPASFAPSVAQALDEVKRPTLVWLNFQDCTGDTEALLRAANPTVGEIVLDILSVDYHETIMAAAGHQADEALEKTIATYKGKYICVVEGSISMKDGGVYGCTSGKTHLEIARRVCGGALATIAIGTCASYGGIPAAVPNPTGAVGVREAVPGATVINLPGCPCNADNLTATIVHYLVFGKIPAWTATAARCSPTANASMTTVSAGRISTPASMSSTGATMPIARGSVSTRWGARGRLPSTTARRSATTKRPAGRLLPVTAVPAVPNRNSGIPCGRCTAVCRMFPASASRQPPTRSVLVWWPVPLRPSPFMAP